MCAVMTEVRCVLVTGAAGGVGRSVCETLIRGGFAVRALIRPEDDRRAVQLSDSSFVLGDVQDGASVKRAMVGADAVVHCAPVLQNTPGVLPTNTTASTVAAQKWTSDLPLP